MLSVRSTSVSAVLDEQLLVTKLHVPPLRPEAVPRPRLTELLSEGAQGKLTVVSAPAGSGKTTLLVEWFARTEKPAGWISLDKTDNDPAVFLTYLIAALRELCPHMGEDALELLRSSRQTPVERILTILLNEVASVPEDLLLILDDYHVVESEVIHHAVRFMLDYMPSQMHLFLVSRSEPPLSLARLMARGQLVRLTAADLRLTPEEASTFLSNTMDLDLSPERAASLYASTEGWAAGLQFASLSIRETKRIPEMTGSFTGTNRYLLDYLADEVLRHQDQEVRDFLLQTSILERVCAPLCDAVTGRSDGREMLDVLERCNLFLIPLDAGRQWYRYHHLFSDFLLRNLRDSRSECLPELHRRACDWFERSDLVAEAVSHALAANDLGRTASLLERVARTTLERGELSTLRRWLEALPETLICSRPRLCLFYAWYCLATGNLAAVEPYLRRAEHDLGVTADVPAVPLARISQRTAAGRGHLAGHSRAVLRRRGQVSHHLPGQPRSDRGSRPNLSGTGFARRAIGAPVGSGRLGVESVSDT